MSERRLTPKADSDKATPEKAKQPMFTVLGSGTSAGIPIIACDCDVCHSDDPRDRRTRPSSCLEFVDPAGTPRCILLDTSPDLREQALRHRLKRCDAVLFTHSHFDHTFGLDDVRRFNAVMKDAIAVYAEAPTMDFLERVYEHIFQPHRNVNASFVARLVPRLIDPERPIELFGLSILPIRLLHGKLPVLGFRIEAKDPTIDSPIFPLAYCTDVSEFPEESWSKLEGVKTLVLDMLRYKPHPTHFSVDEAIDHAARVSAEQTYFVHMAHEIRHADLDARLPPGMQLAYDGLVLR